MLSKSTLLALQVALTALATDRTTEASDAKAKPRCTASEDHAVCTLGTISGRLISPQTPSQLAIDISIEVRKTDVDAFLAKEQPLRATVVNAIQATSKAAATTDQGRMKLREDIHRAIDQTLAPVAPLRVYFTRQEIQPTAP
ncbi:MAG: hypothetical protein CL927_00595 [Deltaproteobacteria bacterium]|nr:hypothetical protein [Deltaproteobacteria bacterium]HCH63758.1 hypothetical protein [Deltaproteobacteria bacterium]|tara:strand:+ start:694 stop:1119 length:426 start_codon:yes stop_codon:yes gene_type:complete